MKYVLVIALAAGLMVTGQTSAKDVENHIVVSSRPPVNVWVHRLNGELSDNLRFPVSLGSDRRSTGFVSVRFECGQDGKPTNLTLVHPADRRLDAQAMRAVRALRTLHPLPDGVEPGRQMQANLIFADSRDDLQRQTRLLQRAEAQRLAASPEERNVLALNLESRSPG
ncbi:energy transducer TonB [Novosphingobium sp. KCTC 2891]|uniref:energy transducer TonB family protein n=1 Tax=Novosphingobium sp. KCTC 2891 TaxID=2989730 RepID=UPI002222CA08|nr:energy transducer TonB [Novosphingobium sp. KCTC 2891]MCW1384059.1 energy transducer TonB [Novosphingobium sp. KCTC 2891]